MIKKWMTGMALWALFGYTAAAQGYKIDVTLDGAKDSTVYLAVYNGEGKYARDTARTDQKGRAVFAKDRPLAGGMYILVSGGIQLCDFLISDDNSQRFGIHYRKNREAPAEIVFKNSPENTAFSEFQRKMAQWQSASRRLRERAQQDTAFRTVAIDSLTAIADEEKEFTARMAAQWSGKLLGTMAKAMQPPPSMPEPETSKDDPKYDSIYWSRYYQWEKNHFFDNVDFSDARLLNTPLFLPNFEYYFNKRIAQHPDSIISAAHVVLEKAKAHDDMFAFCLGRLFNTYIQWKMLSITPEYAVGMEAVVVDLIKNYYLSGEAKWAQSDTTFIKQIRDYARFNEHSLVGVRAHDLKMQAITGEWVTLHGFGSPYVLLIFFDTNCGHCQKEIPQVYEVYKNFREKGLQAMCVYIGKDGPEWQKFLEKHELDWVNVWDPYETNPFRELYTVQTTPQIYLLNRDKTIIARHITHDLLAQLMAFYIDKTPMKQDE
jgi:peroxiredoxin